MNEKIKSLLKISVSFSLFFLIVYFTGPSGIWENLKEANFIFLFSAILLVAVVGRLLSAKKLQVLLRAKGEKIGYLSVLRYYYIGTFFNIFLPTTIGGDVVKAYKISDKTEAGEEAYSSVFMERFTGLVALVSLASVSSLVYLEGVPEVALLVIFLVFLPLIFFLTLFMTRKSAIRKLKPVYTRIFPLFEFFDLREKIKKLYNSVNQYRKRKRELVWALGISFAFHILLISSNFLLSKSLGMEVPFYYFFIFIPVCAVLLFLPISVKGFGVREGLYGYFFGQVGSALAAVSMSILFQIAVITGAGIGGIVYLFSEAGS